MEAEWKGKSAGKESMMMMIRFKEKYGANAIEFHRQ